MKTKTLAIILIALAVFSAARPVLAADQTIRIVHGERRLTVAEVILLEEYRLNRNQFLKELKWENEDVEKVRILQNLAMADMEAQVREIRSIFEKLQAEDGVYKRGQVSEFRTLKNLEIVLGQRLNSLDVIKTAYAEVEGIVSGEIAKVDAILDKIGKLRFNVRKSEGWIKREVTFAEIKADNTVSFETLLAEARQINLTELNGPGPVRDAIIAFNAKVYGLMARHLTDFDEFGDRGSFKESSGKLAKTQIEEGLELMSFLRARFGLMQVFPVIKDTGWTAGHFRVDADSQYWYQINGNRMSWFEYRITAADQAPEWLREMERIQGRLDSGWRNSVWPKRIEIRKWFLDSLLVQMKAEIALRTEGRDAAGVRNGAPGDEEAKAILNRVPTNEVVGSFKEVLYAINAAFAHRNLEKPGKTEGPANWDELIGGKTE